jgi:hypothetical protein
VKLSLPSATDEQKIRLLPWSLANGVLTNIFVLWTWGGSVFLLFLSQLGMPKGQIGTLISFFPFTGLLALFLAPWVARLGRKWMFISGYGGRSLVMLALLSIPWLLIKFGYTAAVVTIFVVILAVALLRALAEIAYYPWSQEYIPNRVRGKFSAVSVLLTAITSVGALLVAGSVLAHKSGLSGYMLLIGLGSVVGVIGALTMLPVAGGLPVKEAQESGTHFASMLRAMGDRNLVAYLGAVAASNLGVAFMITFLPLYVKEQVGLPASTVVTLDSVALVGGALSSMFWGWATDRIGSRPVLMPAIALTVTLPLAWLLIPRQFPHAVLWCGALYFIWGVLSNGIQIAGGRLLLNGVVPPEKSTAYTAIYYAWAGLFGGLAPLLAGWLLTATAGWKSNLAGLVVDGHALLFFLALILIGAAVQQFWRVRPDDIYTTRAVLKRLVHRLISRV